MFKKFRKFDWGDFYLFGGGRKAVYALITVAVLVTIGAVVFFWDDLPSLTKPHPPENPAISICNFLPNFSVGRDVTLGGLQTIELKDGERLSLYVTDEKNVEVKSCFDPDGPEVKVITHSDGKYVGQTELVATGPGRFSLNFRNQGKYQIFFSGSDRTGRHPIYIVGLEGFDWENPPNPKYLEPGIYQVVTGEEDFEVQYDEPLKTHLIGVNAEMKMNVGGDTIWKGSNVMIVHPDDAFKWVSLVRKSDNLVIRIQIGVFGNPVRVD